MMEERKPLPKQLLSLASAYLACSVMCLLSVAMLDFLVQSTFGKVGLQIIHFMMMALTMYPQFYDKGLLARLAEHDARQMQIVLKDIKWSLIFFFGYLYGSVLLLIMMKLSILPDILGLYKLLNIPFWGSLMIVMEQATVASVSWPAIMVTALLPLLYVVIVLAGLLFGYQNTTVRGMLRKSLKQKE